MARLEDNPATDAEYAQLITLPDFKDLTRDEANLMTPDERAEFLSGEDTSDPKEAQAAQDLADGQPDTAHAETETAVDMPHEVAELPVAEAEVPEVEAKPAVAAKPVAAVVEPVVVEPVVAAAEPVVEAVADEPIADPEPPTQAPPRQHDARDFAALRKDLSGKFGEGEISNEEYTEQLAELISAETTQRVRIETKKENAEQRWLDDQIAFLDHNPEYHPNRSQARFDAFNNRVIALAKDPANANKSGRWHLLEAQRQVEKEIGSGKKVATAVPPPAPVVAPKPPRRPDLKSVPTTLAHVPAAASEEVSDGDNEFAAIDKLDGMDQERALAALESRNPAKYAEYLKSA